ncbi:DASH complex subunit Duo1-domain-containing protein [Cantharellus anzutake]|uniref:DASH complex subunit Duo1-domain-containing protein n=1 Tax=Cantharellus anzutake TaxID=1750568 RepID=UPI001907DDD6|nr:DASH complex subunit Duo1-domain-containing protein [Cantharellus anzutake]KAF8326672.1 DASH complex subunit Duo1-domain-containing protein [Cantharellus anzutake]
MSPPDVSELSSHFASATMGPDMSDMSLADLQPQRRPNNVPPPRFSLFKQEKQGDDSGAADDEAEDDIETTLTPGRENIVAVSTSDDRHEHKDPTTFETPVSKAQPTDPLSQEPALHPQQLTEEERLRRQLFDMQRINASFNEYFAALSAVRDRQQSLASKVENTKQLLDRYVAILGQAEHNARLLLDPTWEGAQADSERINEARAREEEEIRKAKEEEMRREEERQRQEEEEQKKLAASAVKRGTVRGRAAVGRGIHARGGNIPARGARLVPSSTGLNRPPVTKANGLRGRGAASGIPQSGIRPPSAIRGSNPRGAGRGTRVV